MKSWQCLACSVKYNVSQSFTKPINARKLFSTQKKNLDIYPNKCQNKTTNYL